MSTERDNGGPAFPMHPDVITGGQDAIESSNLTRAAKDAALEKLGEVATGMALRDYFAAKAMQGLVVTAAENPRRSWEAVAGAAYALADAMLKARQS